MSLEAAIAALAAVVVLLSLPAALLGYRTERVVGRGSDVS